MSDRYAELSDIEQSVIDALGMATAGIEPIGNILRSARESANLSLREVAEKMFLLPNQIEALESGDQGRFRGEFFYKSYLRSYGKLMKLDAQIIIDSCERKQPADTDTFRVTEGRQHIQSPTKGRSIKYWFLAIVVLLGYFLWWANAETEAKNSLGSILSPSNEKNHVDELGAAGSRDTEKLIAHLDNGQTPLVPGNPGTLREDGPIRGQGAAVSLISTGKITEAATVARIIEGAPALTPAKSPDLSGSTTERKDSLSGGELVRNSLNFDFTDDCWVEVRDRDNKIIFSDLKRAEETLSLLGRAPFRILLGFAPGVSLAYNGQPVDILIDKSNNSARLTVGRS